VGKYVNIASRTARFIVDRFDGRLGPVDAEALAPFKAAHRDERLHRAFEDADYGRALREAMALADAANHYINEHKPWELAKTGEIERLQRVCSTALTMFRDLTRLLKPVLPRTAARVERFLAIEPLRWGEDWAPLPAGHRIEAYEHLLTRIERKAIDALVEANREALAPTAPPPAAAKSEAAAPITLEQFLAVDLRVARVIAAEAVEGADKLLRLLLDAGEREEDGSVRVRQVFAGIKSAYDPAALVGRLVVLVANLAPRKMKFGLSEGMVLAASDPDGKHPGIYLVSPDEGALPGMRIK
jgi:methionyl-tRNA synthetase